MNDSHTIAPRQHDAGHVGKDSRLNSLRSSGNRFPGRITKEDIRSAGLRRWNGRSRITTDWFNLYHEPELCFPNGDLLVYLRQPGQSSRGPAFRVHIGVLKERGLEALLDRCVTRSVFHTPSRTCMLNACPGCDKHNPTAELYIPAPFTTDIDDVFDHHITTRNVFAFLYNLPLAGRALGQSLAFLRTRIDQYRHVPDSTLNKREVIAYAESQKYLDYRECIDHALAALTLAENLQQEDMWIDAFVHTVGMSHRGMISSLEYEALSPTTQSLILESRLEMDVRLARASVSIETFFGDDLSGSFLGLSQDARDHFDRFRSFLHAFYIESYGFWPPAGFDSDTTRIAIYSSLYSDFRNLYHHLVDPESSQDAGTSLANAGGVCTLQNIQAFDTRNGFQSLPNPLPFQPKEMSELPRLGKTSRRRSWNPVVQKRIDREIKTAQRKQALVLASNRDMILMNCGIVRKYSEFEADSVDDPSDQISWIEGRKVRWILVYAVLQTLISIMTAPKHVRHSEGLSYSLCCNVPIRFPWTRRATKESMVSSSNTEIVPDINYLHSNHSTGTVESRQPRSAGKNPRRMTLSSRPTLSDTRSSSLPRVASLKRLLSRRRVSTDTSAPPLPSMGTSSHCEILVHGYGNGLNEVHVEGGVTMTLPTKEQMKRRSSLVPSLVPDDITSKKSDEQRMPHDGDENAEHATLSSTASASVSRETSNASNASSNSSKSISTTDSDSDVPTPIDNKNMTQLIQILEHTDISAKTGEEYCYDEINGLPGSIHINTQTWDAILTDTRI